MTKNPKLEVRGARHWFETPTARIDVLAGVDIRVDEGEFVCLLGPSGSGKTTLFNAIAGLISLCDGSIAYDGREITGNTGLFGYQLQKDLLLPWRTVLDNVILGLELEGMRRSEARKQARPMLDRYGLAGFGDQYPSSLSGGMRQRAAVMRTLLYDREVILLDEPFGALDALTRSQMQTWLLDTWREFKKTVLFITHDVDEAIFLADRVVVLSNRPAVVVDELSVDLPRPRLRDVTLEPAFIAAKRQVLDVLGT